MRRFVTLNCFLDYTDTEPFSIDFSNLRQVNFVPAVYKPGILQALRRANFRYHRTCSYSSLLRECNVGKSETLLMFWSGHSSDSKITMSISASSCSSVHLSSGGQCKRERDLLSTAQQTDISCRSPGIASPVYLTETEEHRLVRARVVESFSFSSPASSLLQPAERSMSILSSVCALLLNKQGSAAVKAVSSVSGSTRSDNICRICFGGESAERLVRPCSCRGTIAAVHRSCLERWLLQAATSYCELCRHHYVVTRSHKWSWARSVWAWARSGRGRALAADAWRALALGAASVAGTARALHACDAALQAGARRGGSAALAANLFSSLLIGIIGALNGLLTTWMLLKIQEHQASWRTWRDSTLHVHVTLAGEEELVAEGQGEGQAASPLSTQPSDATVVGATADRSTNVADPFMVALPVRLPEL